jgi:Mce-associated membrane protein
MTATLDTKTDEAGKKAKRKLALPKLSRPTLPKWSGKRWAAVGGAGAVVLGSLGVAGTSLFFWNQESNLRHAYDAAQKAACAYAPKLGNYDSANLDPFFQGLLDGSTGEAKARFAETAKFGELRTVLKEAKATSIVDDAQCGVRGGTADQVDVVIVMAARSGSLGTQGQMVPKQVGVVATMSLVDGKWLCSKLDAPFLTQ